MTEAESFAFPEPRDDDDDDVVWVLQAGAAEWHRGGYAEAVTWLRRGVEAANAAGNAFRAAELNAIAEAAIEQLGIESIDEATTATRLPTEPLGEPGGDDFVTEVEEIDFIEGDLISADEASRSEYKTDIPLPSFELRLSDAPSLPPESADFSNGLQVSDDLSEAPTIPPDRNRAKQELGVVVPQAAAIPSELMDGMGEHTARAGEEADSDSSAADSGDSADGSGEQDTVLDGVPVGDCPGFEDLSEEGQAALTRTARLLSLAVDEEVAGFGAVLVTRGAVAIMPEIGDELGAMATKGDVVFTRGTLVDGTRLRVVATTERTVVGVWSSEELQHVLAESPWVGDELRRIADRFQALAGATLGVLGERLDLSLRRAVTDRMEVKAFVPGEIIVKQGVAVPGLHIVGAGRVELFANDGAGDVVEEHHPGDFLFAESMMGAQVAPLSARAGSGGALVLFAPRRVTHELMTSVPLFLEALAS